MKISAEIVRRVTRWNKIEDNFVYDRFGILDNIPNPMPYPEKTDLNFIEYSLKRTNDLGKDFTICWSGGIDSTFIICCFLQAGISFKVICSPESIVQNGMFYSYMLSKKIDVKVCNLMDFPKDIKYLTGEGYMYVFTKLYDLESRYTVFNKINDKTMVDCFINYVNKLGYLLKINEYDNIVYYLIIFCFFYYHGRDYFCANLGIPEKNYLSFFDTKEYTDICWSKLGDNSYEYHKKYELRKFITEVTGNNKYFRYLERTPSHLYMPYSKCKKIDLSSYKIINF